MRLWGEPISALPHGQACSTAGQVSHQVGEVGSWAVRLVPAVLQVGGAAQPHQAEAQPDEGQAQASWNPDDGRQVIL